MTTFNLVDEHPLVKAADAKLADLERRLNDFEARLAPVAAEDAEAQQAYDEAVNAALLEGAPLPQPPVRRLPQGRDVEIRLSFMDERQRLTEERQKAVADAYPDVLAEARSEAAKLVTATRPTVEKLAAAMAELGELLGAVKTCRTAVNATSTDGRREYHDTPMTVEEFVRLVASAGDPIAGVDLAGNRGVQPRNTGMIWGDIAQLIEDTGGGQRVRA